MTNVDAAAADNRGNPDSCFRSHFEVRQIRRLSTGDCAFAYWRQYREWRVQSRRGSVPCLRVRTAYSLCPPCLATRLSCKKHQGVVKKIAVVVRLAGENEVGISQSIYQETCIDVRWKPNSIKAVSVYKFVASITSRGDV